MQFPTINNRNVTKSFKYPISEDQSEHKKKQFQILRNQKIGSAFAQPSQRKCSNTEILSGIERKD